MDDKEHTEDYQTEDDNKSDSDGDQEKPKDTGNQNNDDSILNETVSDGNDTEDTAVYPNDKVAVDQKPRDKKVAVAADKGNESFELDELAKITLGTGDTDISVESEEMESKDDGTKDDLKSKPPRSSRATRRRMPTGGYAALNSSRKKVEKKDIKHKPKEVKKQIQEKKYHPASENWEQQTKKRNRQSEWWELRIIQSKRDTPQWMRPTKR